MLSAPREGRVHPGLKEEFVSHQQEGRPMEWIIQKIDRRKKRILRKVPRTSAQVQHEKGEAN